MGIIKLKRGNKVNLGTATLQAGEPAFVLDDKEFYIGDGTGKVLINPIKSVAGKTGTVVLSKTDVGLNNVDNESKVSMFTSPNFTGTPKSTTATIGDNTTNIATTAFVTTAVNNKTSITGNAGTSSKLATARTITLAGSVTGSASFDGSSNITITTTGVGETTGDVDGGTF